mmetsp:Transcript_48557/g.113890  ORF Transcript_48557/g.113890 Transcript_48557/m.113890 type:complete len:318 (-) Transcript_48557:122-1075(-)
MVHLILVLAVFWLPCYARPSPKYFSSGDKAKYAACGFDVWAAVNSIGFAGLSINAASKECKGADSPLKKTVCTSAVAGTHAALADVASFLSSSASDCAKDLNNQAYCAADSSGLVSGLANIATASAAMHAVCEKSAVRFSVKSELGLDVRRLTELRRLQQAGTNQSEFVLPASPVEVRQEADLDWWEKVFSNVRKAEIAECVFNTNMAAQLLGRMGLAIQASTQDCTDFNFKINGAGGQKVCAVDLAGVIGSFMGAGQFLSALASKCTGKAYPAADCTSAAFQVIGAIDTLAAVGASFPLTCGGEGEELDYKDFILP